MAAVMPAPTGWIRWIPSFRKAWKSLIFEQLYPSLRLRSLSNPRVGLVTGFFVSVLVGWIWMPKFALHGQFDEGFLYLAVIPASIPLALAFMRLLFSMFVSVPARLDKLLQGDSAQTASFRSIPESELVLVGSFAPILLARDVLEEAFNFAVAVLPGFMLVFSLTEKPNWYSIDTELNMDGFWGFYLFCLLNIFLIIILFSVLADFYSQRCKKPILAFLATFANVVALWIVSLIPSALILPNFVKSSYDYVITDWIAQLVLGMLQIAMLLLMIKVSLGMNKAHWGPA